MNPPRFRIRTVLIATTVVAFLLGILQPTLFGITCFGVFAAMVLTPQWAFVSRSPGRSSTERMLWIATACGPGSVLAGLVCALMGEISHAISGLYDPKLEFIANAVVVLHMLAAFSYAGALVEQLVKRRNAGVWLNAICAAYSVFWIVALCS